MKLPLKLNWDIAQNRWATILGPIIENPIANCNILKNIELKTGVNVINHKLSRPIQGWFTTRVRATATFYDEQDTNAYPNLTLILVSSADTTIDLAVF